MSDFDKALERLKSDPAVVPLDGKLTVGSVFKVLPGGGKYMVTDMLTEARPEDPPKIIVQPA